MRVPTTFRRSVRMAILAFGGVAVAGAASAALWVDNTPTTVAAGGDFEGSTVSLRLPAVDRFPLVAGGWGARAATGTAIRSSRTAAVGEASLEIEASARQPAHVIQDVPLGTRSFQFEMDVQRQRGRQTVSLVDGWDRHDPATAPASLQLEMTPRGLTVTTLAGSWDFNTRVLPDRWSRIAIVTDAREEQTRVSVNGRLVGIVPGLPKRAPSTVIIGGSRGQRSSIFRYDGISLLRLSELELAELHARLLRQAPAEMQSLLGRIDMAAQAIDLGAPYLATPELRALARTLEGRDDDDGTRSLALGLIRLLDTR